MENTRKSQSIESSCEDGARVEDRRKQAAELLNAIETGLPDSQFAPDTRAALNRLLALAGDLQQQELVNYLQHAERLSTAARARDRDGFQSAIRLCRDLVDQDPNEIPGLAKLRVWYIDHQHAELDRLNQALKDSDFAVLGKGGHNLKGTGAGYGFSELTDIGRALETAAKEGNAATAEVLLEQLEWYLRMVRPSEEPGFAPAPIALAEIAPLL